MLRRLVNNGQCVELNAEQIESERATNSGQRVSSENRGDTRRVTVV